MADQIDVIKQNVEVILKPSPAVNVLKQNVEVILKPQALTRTKRKTRTAYITYSG